GGGALRRRSPGLRRAVPARARTARLTRGGRGTRGVSVARQGVRRAHRPRVRRRSPPAARRPAARRDRGRPRAPAGGSLRLARGPPRDSPHIRPCIRHLAAPAVGLSPAPVKWIGDPRASLVIAALLCLIAAAGCREPQDKLQPGERYARRFLPFDPK